MATPLPATEITLARVGKYLEARPRAHSPPPRHHPGRTLQITMNLEFLVLRRAKATRVINEHTRRENGNQRGNEQNNEQDHSNPRMGKYVAQLPVHDNADEAEPYTCQ